MVNLYVKIGLAIFVILVSYVLLFHMYGTFDELRRILKTIPCEDLPSIEKVNTALEELKMKGTLNEYLQFQENIHGEIMLDAERCPGKADIRIDYETSFDRAKIKKLIKDAFTDIPYRMMNR